VLGLHVQKILWMQKCEIKEKEKKFNQEISVDLNDMELNDMEFLLRKLPNLIYILSFPKLLSLWGSFLEIHQQFP